MAQVAQTAVAATLTSQPHLRAEVGESPTAYVAATVTSSTTPTAILPTQTPPPKPTCTATLEPTAVPEVTVIVNVLNVRAGPGTEYPVVAKIKKGESFQVFGQNADKTWLEIRLSGGGTGWVSRKLVVVSGNVTGIEVVRDIPTPPPVRKSSARTLQVSFLNPHYECQQREWRYTGDDGKLHPIWGYRSFQVDMYIRNNGSEEVKPPWQPTRWIITDGVHEYVNDIMWQWVSRKGFYKQPVIHPGESAGWTFLAFPIARNQWVKAVEFWWNGQEYYKTFDLGPYHNAYNYKDCGEPAPHTVRPTPTPYKGR